MVWQQPECYIKMVIITNVQTHNEYKSMPGAPAIWQTQTARKTEKEEKKMHRVQYNYRQDLPEGQLCRYCFYSRADFRVFRPAGATHCSGPSAPQCQISPWSVQGWGLRPPKLKKWNFTNLNAPKGRVPCMIFTKFTNFMRVLSLHNFAKFGCFISIKWQNY